MERRRKLVVNARFSIFHTIERKATAHGTMCPTISSVAYRAYGIPKKPNSTTDMCTRM